jgi:hypothetical protein
MIDDLATYPHLVLHDTVSQQRSLERTARKETRLEGLMGRDHELKCGHHFPFPLSPSSRAPLPNLYPNSSDEVNLCRCLIAKRQFLELTQFLDFRGR